MSAQHRNVKIIQDSLCRQSRRPIWTSFHLAERGAVLAGSVYQSYKFIGTGWQALCAVALFLCLFFDPDLYSLSAALLSYTLSDSFDIFQSSSCWSMKVLPWRGGPPGCDWDSWCQRLLPDWRYTPGWLKVKCFGEFCWFSIAVLPVCYSHAIYHSGLHICFQKG